VLEEKRQSWLIVVNRRWLDRLSVLERLRLDDKAVRVGACDQEHSESAQRSKGGGALSCHGR